MCEYLQRLERRRMRAAELFEQGLLQVEVAGKLRVSRQSVHRWHEAWERGGKQALRSASRKGPAPRLSVPQFEQLEKALVAGPKQFGFSSDLWTLPRIAQVIQRLFGVGYHPSHVWKILRKLGWSCQRPATRAKERDEAEIRRWLSERWPEIKRGPRSKEQRWFSWMKAVFPSVPAFGALGREKEQLPS